MRDEPERYDMCTSGLPDAGSGMIPASGGAWVRYSDYEKLKANQAETSPPAQEVEGLRERQGIEQIADCLEEALGGPQFKHDVRVVYVRMLAKAAVEFDAWLSFRPEFKEALDAFRKAFGTDTRPPSDSQGEQERWPDEGLVHPPLENRSKARLSADPASTQVEGDIERQKKLDAMVEEIVVEHRVNEATAYAMARRRLGQPKPGGEEDWPEIWIQRPTPEADAENYSVWGRVANDAVPHPNEDSEFEWYVPATSQDCSELEERHEKQRAAIKECEEHLERERDRANKAEAERDEQRDRAHEAEANLEAEVANKERLQRAKQRAKAAIEELAAEFGRRSNSPSQGLGEKLALERAAALCREKAAELKDGGS